MKCKMVLMLTGLFLSTLCAGSQESLFQSRQLNDLHGHVTNGHGQPLAEAHVFIYTGKPRVGPGYLCPSCYADCTKQAATNTEGRFVIKSLDPELIFCLLVVCDDYSSRLVPDVDPNQGPVSITLDRLDLADVPSQRIIRGRIVDKAKNPIKGASVSVEGWGVNATRFTWGPASEVMLTPVAVSDLQGHFVLVASRDLRRVELSVQSPDYAQADFSEIPLGAPSRDFVLETGAMVTGRLLHDGQPLSGRTMSISSDNRAAGSNFTHETTTTDLQGRFTFFHLPVALNYHVTATMKSIGELGIAPLKPVQNLENDETRDVGDLTIQPGLTIGGIVKLSDGRPIPPDAVIILSHDQIWESQSQPLPEDGHFRLIGLHPGQIRCTLRVPGYRLAPLNHSYNSLNGGELLATLTESATHLVLLMEPGRPDWNNNDFPPGFPWKESAQFQPLGGVEPLPAARLAGRVTLRVIDADTQAALPAYRVTPGWTFGRNPQPTWQPFKEQTLHPSDPSIEVEKRSGPAYLRITAEGHLPTIVNVEGKIDQTLTITLHPGKGVAGVVVQPDGQPASAAQVVMLKRPDHSPFPLPVSLHEGRFNPSMLHEDSLIQTDPQGHFVFAPTSEVFPLLIAHESGFTLFKDPQPGTTSTIHLQPWASISGSIQDFNESSEMFISLSPKRPHLSEDPKQSKQGFWANLIHDALDKNKKATPSEKPPLLPNINDTAPDAKGHFTIDHVPAGHYWLVVSRKKILPDMPHDVFTLEPVYTVEVDTTPGAVTNVQVDTHSQTKPEQP